VQCLARSSKRLAESYTAIGMHSGTPTDSCSLRRATMSWPRACCQGGLHGGVHKCFDHQAAHGRRSTRCPAPGRRRRVPRSRRSRKLISGLPGSRPLDAGFPGPKLAGPASDLLWTVVGGPANRLPQSDSARRTGGSARPARGASRQPTRTYSAGPVAWPLRQSYFP
jgi:hypothetical protein